MAKGDTPLRNFRFPDDEWDYADRSTRAYGTDRSSVIREALREWNRTHPVTRTGPLRRLAPPVDNDAAEANTR